MGMYIRGQGLSTNIGPLWAMTIPQYIILCLNKFNQRLHYPLPLFEQKWWMCGVLNHAYFI